MPSYQIVSKRFGFLRKLVSLPSKEILERESALVQAYLEDLESSFPTETIHFSELLKTELGKKKTGTEKVVMELNMYHLITENAMYGCFPNMEIALRM